MKTITFYSYKGGVGRSLALTNIATRLLEFGRKVCLLDFDLEAPGLHLKLSHLSERIKIEKGIVDYVYSYVNEGILEPNIKEFVVNVSDLKNGNELYLIPAGNTDSRSYWKKLSSIDWHEFLYESNKGIGFFLDLKQKIEKQLNPDFLLIDSRTGISEMSGITISLFADEVVIVAANNRENLEGAKKIINALVDSEHSILGNKIKVTFVLSRIPFTDKPEDKAKEQILVDKIRSDFANYSVANINVIHSDRDLEENEVIKIGYEKDDSAAQISRDYLKLFEQITEGELTAEEVKRFNDIKSSEKFFQKAIQAESLKEKIDLMSKAIAFSPDNLGFLFRRGIIYKAAGDYDKARADFKEVLRRNDSLKIALLFLGNLEFAAGNYMEAEELFKAVLEKDSGSFGPYYNLGQIYQKTNRPEDAISYYSKALAINPAFGPAYNNRAIIYRRLGRLDEAMDDAYKALEINSDHAIFYATLAEVLAARSDLNGFYLNLEVALKMDAKAVAVAINEEDIYVNFYSEKRFLLLMEKYNILLTI
jgi:tetratricopeptide (TPR) repeat protein/Mrp family chromosome partitioning ATPase